MHFNVQNVMTVTQYALKPTQNIYFSIRSNSIFLPCKQASTTKKTTATLLQQRRKQKISK